MNEYNDKGEPHGYWEEAAFNVLVDRGLWDGKGEPHGYWEDGIKKVNYLNGIKHGKYENYWDTNFKKIFCRGNYHMDRRSNLWEWYDSDGKTLYRKEFFL